LARLLILLSVGIIAYLVYHRFKAIPPSQRKGAYIKIGLALLVAVVVLGTVTGRLHWLGAAFTALLVGISRGIPILIRLFPMLQWLQGQRARAGQSSGRQSRVETALLRMTLDHDTGDMRGEVLSGDFAGQQLEELNRIQLESLLSWCKQQDADSAGLLETYLVRRFGNQERYQQYSQQTPSGSSMSRQEALAILGLPEESSEDDIADAYRRLMQKLHPDRGGSDYLAAKLNLAKDTLLG